MFEFLVQHQFWAAVAAYWIFSAAVSAMPEPGASGSPDPRRVPGETRPARSRGISFQRHSGDRRVIREAPVGNRHSVPVVVYANDNAVRSHIPGFNTH